jgi:hypothetical protein
MPIDPMRGAPIRRAPNAPTSGDAGGARGRGRVCPGRGRLLDGQPIIEEAR